MSKFTKCRANIKIVVVGNSGTGKTSFCKRWISDKFDNSYQATVMSDFSYKVCEFEGNFYKVQFWDIAGADKNIYTSKVFTKDSHGCLIVADITNPDTLNKTLLWKKSIDENTRFLDNQMLPCILIVNKIDLIDDDFIQNDDEIKKFAEDNKFDNLFKTSAKLGIGIDESMDYLIKNILERIEKFKNDNEKNPIEKNRLSLVLEKNKISDEKININNDCC